MTSSSKVARIHKATINKFQTVSKNVSDSNHTGGTIVFKLLGALHTNTLLRDDTGGHVHDVPHPSTCVSCA